MVVLGIVLLARRAIPPSRSPDRLGSPVFESRVGFTVGCSTIAADTSSKARYLLWAGAKPVVFRHVHQTSTEQPSQNDTNHRFTCTDRCLLQPQLDLEEKAIYLNKKRVPDKYGLHLDFDQKTAVPRFLGTSALSPVCLQRNHETFVRGSSYMSPGRSGPYFRVE